LARLGSLEILVKDRQSGTLASVAAKPNHSAEKLDGDLFSGMARPLQDHHDLDYDSPAKVLMTKAFGFLWRRFCHDREGFVLRGWRACSTGLRMRQGRNAGTGLIARIRPAA
jgi:hypothetical protein